jgi:hypothetical protein
MASYSTAPVEEWLTAPSFSRYYVPSDHVVTFREWLREHEELLEDAPTPSFEPPPPTEWSNLI